MLGEGNTSRRTGIEIEPGQALVDEKVSIRLSGLEPGRIVTVRAQTRDGAGKKWESVAGFRAKGDGTVSPGVLRSLSGTYTGVDPMGLFWSMRSLAGRGYTQTLKPSPVIITAEADGKSVASGTFTRLFAAPGLRRRSVREEGLVGEFFQPPGSGPRPVLMVVGGSGGGLSWSENVAALLASRGYAALALAYFGMEGLPPALSEIPLEYFAKAIKWLRGRKGLDEEKLAVIGVSKGGELALLLGATFPEIKAVVACSGSGVVFNGLGGRIASSWTMDGKPVPFVPFKVDSFFSRVDPQKPVPFVEFYRDNLKDKKAIETASIPVEKINGPVLLISGAADQVWPARMLSELARKRLERHHHPYPDRHLEYPPAGHLTKYPYLPTTSVGIKIPEMGFTLAFGGTPAANAGAAADFWPRIFAFLGGCFRREKS